MTTRSTVQASRVSAAEARKRLRSARVSAMSVSQRLAVAFERILYAAVFGGLAIEVARGAVQRADGQTVSLGDPDAALLQWTAIAVAGVVITLVFKALLTFGPIFASLHTQLWLLSTPIDRRMLLLGRFAALLLVGAAAGAAAAVFFLGITRLSVLPTPSALAAGAALGVTAVSVSVIVQQRAWTRQVQRLLNLVIVSVVLMTSAVVLLRPPLPLLPAEVGRSESSTAVVVILLAVATVAVFCALRALERLNRASLSAGIDIATATAVSVTFLDLSILSSVVVVRRARAIGRVRSVRIRGGRMLALVHADWTRVRRIWVGLFVWAALVPVPYVVGLTGLSGLLPAVHLVAAFLATDRLAGGLRFVCRSEAIRRALGGSDRELRLVHLVVPACGATVWCTLTAILTPGLTILTASISAVGALIVTYRIATRPPLDYASPFYDFGLFGPAPVGLFIQLSRGPALLVVLGWLQIALAN